MIIANAILLNRLSSGQSTPASIFNPTNHVFWFDGDDLELSGSDVDKAINKFNNSTYDAVKVTDLTRPSIVSGPNSKNAIRFTRTNNQILQSGNFANLQDFTFFIVFKANSTSGVQTIVQNQDLTTQGYKLRINSGAITLTVQNSGQAGSGVTTTSFPFTDTSGWHVLMVKYYRQRIAEQFNGTQGIVSRVVIKLDNEVKIATMDQRRTITSTAVTKLGSDSSNNSLDADIAELVCVSKFASDSEELNVYKYFNSKYGLSIPESIPQYFYENTNLNFNGQTSGFDVANQRIQFKVAIPNSDQPLIPLIMVPGYAQGMDFFTTTVIKRIASNYNGKIAAIPVNHRGVGLSNGAQDDGARQIHDYYDVLTYMRASHPDLINQNVACGYGISAGGGDMLGAASKFPDLFSTIITHFPMSDYGYDGTFGWWHQNASFRANLETRIGGTPAAVPNNYRSRFHLESIAKNYQGHLWLIHDASDSTVNVNQSERVETEFINEGKSEQCTFLRSQSSDVIRYTHGYPTDAGTTGIATAETLWAPYVIEANEINIPDSGILRINGYLITKKFKIWLSDGTSSETGRRRSADLVYNWIDNEYTLTPLLESGATDLTAEITVLSGTHSGKTATGTISSETQFTPV